MRGAQPGEWGLRPTCPPTCPEEGGLGGSATASIASDAMAAKPDGRIVLGWRHSQACWAAVLAHGFLQGTLSAQLPGLASCKPSGPPPLRPACLPCPTSPATPLAAGDCRPDGEEGAAAAAGRVHAAQARGAGGPGGSAQGGAPGSGLPWLCLLCVFSSEVLHAACLGPRCALMIEGIHARATDGISAFSYPHVHRLPGRSAGWAASDGRRVAGQGWPRSAPVLPAHPTCDAPAGCDCCRG